MTGIREIGSIGNYYGCLRVREESNRFFWSIENYDGDHWEEIPESLYLELIKFNDKASELI